MIQHNGQSHLINAHEVMFPMPSTIQAIMEAAIINMAEAAVDLVTDNEQDPTKALVEQQFQHLHNLAADMIESTIDELKTQLLASLSEKRYTAQVTGLEYDDLGALADVRVMINFN
jgi:hypothetical protein